MKKLLSVLLAVCMVLPTMVFAAPGAVATVETAKEQAQVLTEEQAAELMGTVPATAIKPGINLLTGTSEPLTGENTTDAALKALIFASGSGYPKDAEGNLDKTQTVKTSVSVAENPSVAGDKVIKFNVPGNRHDGSGNALNYPAMELDIAGKNFESLIGHNMLHFKIKYSKEFDTTTGTHDKANAVWFMINNGNGGNVVSSIPIVANSGWKSVNALYNLLCKDQKPGVSTTSSVIEKLRIQVEAQSANTVDTNYYFDDMYMVPAYRFRYYSPDGETLFKTEYKAFDDAGNIITTVTPETGLVDDYFVTGWSTEKGGQAVPATYTLNNENVDFYAIGTKAVTLNAEGYLSDAGDTMTLTPVIVNGLKDTLVASKGTWTIEDDSVATIVKNSNGSATITAVSTGTTTATYTVGTVSVTYEIKVVLPYTVALDKLDGASEIELATSDYASLVVKTKGNATSELSFSIDGSEETTVEVRGNADGSVRDNYFDLTKLAGWTSGSKVVFNAAGDAEILSVKLYTVYDSDFYLDIVSKSALMTTPGEEIDLTANFTSNLEGVYNQSVTWTVVDDNDVVSHKAYSDGTLKIRAKVGSGKVTVKATSTEDASHVATKDIYVNVDTAKYGMWFDALGATTLEETGIKKLTSSSTGQGTHDIYLGEDTIVVDYPTTAGGTGGFGHTNSVCVPASQKYIVIKTKNSTASYFNFYYKWDSEAFGSSITVKSNACLVAKQADGTTWHVLYLKDVPEDATNITGFMGQINSKSKSEIIYMYSSSEMPELDEVGFTWKMDGSSGTVKFSEHHLLYESDGESYKFSMLHADIGNGVQAVMPTEATLSDGTEIYKLTAKASGAMASGNIPSICIGDYPYLVLTYKSSGDDSFVKFYLLDEDKGGIESGYDIPHIYFDDTNGEYVTKAYYLPSLSGAGAAFNTNFKNFMFAYRGKGILDNVKYDEAGEFYYVEKPVTYKSRTWIQIKELSFMNYDPTTAALNINITLTPDKKAITEDEGSLTITPEVFANQAISTKAVKWTVEGDCVIPKENEDGTITLNAVKNGDVTVTATAVEDSSFKSSITINVSGQREKVASYEFKYYAMGNSFLSHGVFNGGNGWPWPDPEKEARGMAASSYDKDYYALVQKYLLENFHATLESYRKNYAGLEGVANYKADDAIPVKTGEQVVAAVKAHASYTEIKNYLLNEKPNLITVQLSENFGSPYKLQDVAGATTAQKEAKEREITEAFYETLYSMIDESRPAESVVVVMVPFRTDLRTTIIKEYAAKYGFYIADMSDVPGYSVVDTNNRYLVKDGVTYDRGTKEGWKYNPYLAWGQYPEYDTYREEHYDAVNNKYPTEFRSHPGDLGMELIATRMVEQFVNAVPFHLDAEYIYIPESIEISGGNAITTRGGTLSLTVTAAPSDSSNDVVWSVDNENLAEITQAGVLSAKVNGTVTVTAKSAYSDEVYDTVTVTITGQDPVYTLSYNAGTTATVTGLPADDNYARGEYTLSAAAPSRTGYKFLGWALAENGNVVENVTVNEDTTVYAVWTLAEGWHFDNGENEGIVFGGFNEKIEEGIGSVLSYGDGVMISHESLLIDSELFNTLSFRFSLTDTTETEPALAVSVTSTEGTYSFNADIASVGTFTTYTLDLSEVKGTITSFRIAPNAPECKACVDWIEFGRTALDEDVSVDKVNVVTDTTVNVGDNNYAVENLNVEEGKTVTFVGGNVEIGTVTGNGTIKAKNANIIYNGDAIEGYVKVELGQLAEGKTVRYAEIDGYQYEMNGNTYGMILADGETKLLQISEKTSDASVEYASKYYKVTKNGAEEITSLNSYMNNVSTLSMRIDTVKGIRFKAAVTNASKESETEFSVDEYGYVIALEKTLDAKGEQLTLDFSSIVTGANYNKKSGEDIVYEKTVENTVFTGVLYGIPEEGYCDNIVTKTYTKLTIDGNTYTVYGEPIVTSAYAVAKELVKNQNLAPEILEEAQYIISVVEK